MRIIKIKIHVTQNVGKANINGEKTPWTPFQAIFSMDWKNAKQTKCMLFATYLGGPMGPIHPVWDGGAMLLEGFGGTLPPKDDAPAG